MKASTEDSFKPITWQVLTTNTFYWPFSRWTWVRHCLLQQSMTEVVVTTGAVSHAKLQSNHHHQQTNTQFLPRDAMHKCSLCCHAVSVCPSVTLVYCIQTAEHIVKLLSRPGSPVTLVFRPRAPIPNSQGNPFSRVQNKWGWEKFAILDWNRHLSLEQYEIGPWLLWNDNRKLYELYRMVTFSMTLTDP